MVLFFVILALVFVLVLVIVSNIVIVPQSKVYVIERLGSYSDTWTEGAGGRLSPSACDHPR